MEMLVWVAVAAVVGFMGWRVVKSKKKDGAPADGLAARNQKKPATKQK